MRSSPAAGQAFDLALAEEAFREAVALNQEESGALIQLARETSLADMLSLGADARVLLLGTEGATDPAIYRRMIGI